MKITRSTKFLASLVFCIALAGIVIADPPSERPYGIATPYWYGFAYR
jgi:hypothetical protein